MKRKRYSPEQKVSIIRDYFEKDISVSDICEKYRIHPNQFYCWKIELFEGAVETLAKSRNPTGFFHGNGKPLSSIGRIISMKDTAGSHT